MNIPVIQSFGALSQSNTDSTSVALAAPSGIQVGDLLIAHVGTESGRAATASDWTSVVGTRQDILWKYATSGDAVASSFTFNFDSSTRYGGRVLRINTHRTSGAVDKSSTATNIASSITVSGVTPTYTNNLIIVFTANEGDVHLNSASTANNNPSWTELYDDVGNGIDIACRYGTYTPTSATGNITATMDASVDTTATALIIASLEAATVSIGAALSLSGTVPDAAISTGSTISISASISLSGTIASPTITAKDNPWTNESKSAAPDWINQDKS